MCKMSQVINIGAYLPQSAEQKLWTFLWEKTGCGKLVALFFCNTAGDLRQTNLLPRKLGFLLLRFPSSIAFQKILRPSWRAWRQRQEEWVSSRKRKRCPKLHLSSDECIPYYSTMCHSWTGYLLVVRTVENRMAETHSQHQQHTHSNAKFIHISK